ncbi:O-antigen ligase family protein [Gillisia sp. Q332]|uniref:O-antigen ligase family protein n=1 Tax=Gillisia xinjiangensis TaxID=3384765 RepID=UPI00391B9848
MKLLIFLLKFGLPLLVVTDLSSQLYSSPLLLNLSRGLRILILILFIIENFRNFNIIRKFKFFNYFLLFNFILFLFLFTDRDFFEGFWIYSKILFWTLGLNVLFAYAFKGIFLFEDFLNVIKRIAIAAFFFTILFVITGFIKDDYNIAAYLVLFIYPIILYSTKGFNYNLFYVLISALAILITLKRGAILAFSIANVLYYFNTLYYDFRVKKLMRGVFILLSLCVIGFFIYEQQKEVIGNRFSEEQFDPDNEKAGSGRVGMYTRLYETWYESDNWIFGFGNQEDSRRTQFRRTHAHSDIFGFLYNYGLVGIGLLIIMYIKLIFFFKNLKNLGLNHTYIGASLITILILVNFYSGLLRSTEAFYLFAILPYLQIKKFEKTNSNYF